MKSAAHVAALLALLPAVACADARVMAEVTETEIQPIGGIARSPDGKLELTFPSQAVPVTTNVRIEIDRTRPAADRVTPIYRLGPEGLKLRGWSDLRLEVDRPAGQIVVLAEIIGDQVVPIADSSYLSEEGAVFGRLQRFSDYTAIAEPDPEARDRGADAGRWPDASAFPADVGWPDAGGPACTLNGNPKGADAAVGLLGLVAEVEPNDTPSSAQYLPWDPTCALLTVEASFATASDADYYFFTVPMGHVGSVRAATHTSQFDIAACRGFSINTSLVLIDSGGRELATDDPTDGRRCSEISETTGAAANLSSGAYYLRVQTHVPPAAPGIEPPYYLSMQLELR